MAKSSLQHSVDFTLSHPARLSDGSILGWALWIFLLIALHSFRCNQWNNHQSRRIPMRLFFATEIESVGLSNRLKSQSSSKPLASNEKFRSTELQALRLFPHNPKSQQCASGCRMDQLSTEHQSQVGLVVDLSCKECHWG